MFSKITRKKGRDDDGVTQKRLLGLVEGSCPRHGKLTCRTVRCSVVPIEEDIGALRRQRRDDQDPETLLNHN